MRRRVVVGALAEGLMVASALAQSTATYTGANNGNWNTPGNWNLGVVPVNSGGSTFNAIVPTNTTVQFDVDGASAISGLNLQSGALLNISSGRQLTVTGVSVTAGMIAASGAATLFQAISPFASMQTNSRAAASGGAIVRLGGISYNCAGYNGNILSASGTGSLLDMSSFGSIIAAYNGGCCSYRDQWVRASSGGVIDLSALTTVVGAAGNGALRFREEGGGQILLPNLVNSSGIVVYEPTSALFSLPSLQSATSAYFITVPGAVFNLPNATNLGSCTLNIASAGSTISAPLLTTCMSTSISLADGGVFHAPALKIFDYSAVQLNPQRTFTVPAFTSIHGSSLRVFGGSHFGVVATSYTTASALGDILTADGAGSLLDVSKLTEIRTPYNGGCCSYGENRVRASSSGVVDLSSVDTLQGVANNGWLRIRAESDGIIKLDALRQTTLAVYFEAFGADLNMPLLESSVSASFNVGVFDTISMESLAEAKACTFNISDGGTVIAPSLETFESSFVELTPSRFFDAPPFKKINESRIFLKEGKQLAVAAGGYINSGRPGDTFTADGFNTLLDLSTLTTFSAPWNGQCCSYGEVVVRASNSGQVDLSGLTSVTGASGNGLTRFDAVSGGTLVFGSPVFGAGYTRISADGVFSHLRFRSLRLRAAAQIQLTLVSNVHFTGDFDFDTKDENSVQLGNGKVVLEGSATSASPQKLEVACPDLGTPVGALAQNFQIGQLTIGRNLQATSALLADEIDNGNRSPGQKERLYLQGFPAENGLRLLGGSTLYLGDIELYAVIGNEWTRIRDLFPPGQSSIPFDDGRIVLGLPIPCNADLNNDGLVDDADFSIFVVAYNLLDCTDPAMPLGCPADLNKDGFVDDSDFTSFVVAYDALLCP